MKDFVGFRFGNIHSKDLNLLITSSSNYYTKNTEPSLKDYTSEVPGGDGSYYFGQTFSSQEFKISVAFDNISEENWRKISQLFSNHKLQDLVFDEYPYKVYKAKLKSAPEFKFICFYDKSTGKRVYKGDGTLNFICYQPYGYCYDKYLIRTADYYKCLPPEKLVSQTPNINPYDNKINREPSGKIREFYNKIPNMETPWQGGYPTFEQVQAGELFFDASDGKKIIDVRDYFSNVPEWQDAAKLLYTPTLDYDGELIYLPQYSQTNYYNMDTGLNRQNGVIGSRILVYNPGDVPIDFQLELGNLVSHFRQDLGKNYRFRISRYNVQRLTIEQAVDWCKLTTYKDEDNADYKYGNRYFTILKTSEKNQNLDWKQVVEGKIYDEEELSDGTVNKIQKKWDYSTSTERLKGIHPKHAYYAEPIPRERLGYFIRLFYWQSKHLKDEKGYTHDAINWEKGQNMANKYEELYDQCISDEERFELYWKTLKEAILDCYDLTNKKMAFGGAIPYLGGGKTTINERLADNYFNGLPDTENRELKGMLYTYENFVHDYINIAPEYINKRDGDLDYGEFIFNIAHYPAYYTDDYLEINTDGFEEIIGCECGCDDCLDELSEREKDLATLRPLQFDFEKRFLYNINEPEWKEDQDWQAQNPTKVKNFQKFKPTKNIWNDNIIKGKWFKLPPGWSLIDISPIIDEKGDLGKEWINATNFKWGSRNEVFRTHFDNIYKEAAIETLVKELPIAAFSIVSPLTNQAVITAKRIVEFGLGHPENISDALGAGVLRIFKNNNTLSKKEKEVVRKTFARIIEDNGNTFYSTEKLLKTLGENFNGIEPNYTNDFYNFLSKFNLGYSEQLIINKQDIINLLSITNDILYRYKNNQEIPDLPDGDKEFNLMWIKNHIVGFSFLPEEMLPNFLNKDGTEKDILAGCFEKYLNTSDILRKILRKSLSFLELDEIEKLLMFKKWYTGYQGVFVGADIAIRYNCYDSSEWKQNFMKEHANDCLNFGFELTKKRIENAERFFLKTLNDYWRANTPNLNGQPTGTIDDWWWYANSYIWENFPPVFWPYADLLNKAKISYIPMYY